MARILVVDASVVVKWFVNEEGSDTAKILRDGDHQLFAPQLMAVEVGNTLWNKSRRGELKPLEAEALASNISALTVNWIADEELVVDAVRLAAALDHPVYDCIYLALAQRVGANVVTADKRFLNVVADTQYRGSVVELGQFAAA